jgi:hypothetical protein
MLVAGLTSGVCVAGLFNPWDRALYLSVLHSRPFLHRANFIHPYTGFAQVIFQRTLSGGLYFPLFDAVQPPMRDFIATHIMPLHQHRHGPDAARLAAEQSALLHCLCGNFAGGVSGILLNGLTAVKYASWDSKNGTPSFFATARAMYAAGGLSPFTKGISATVVRDSVFGGMFALTKLYIARALQPYIAPVPHVHAAGAVSSSMKQVLHAKLSKAAEVNKAAAGATGADAGTVAVSTVTSAASSVSAAPAPQHPPPPAAAAATKLAPPRSPPRLQFSAAHIDFSAALLAGGLATIASAPFNYVRNIKYGWHAAEVPDSGARILLDLMRDIRSSSHPLKHTQERLRLGWGTARVAVGMAVGQWLYEQTKKGLDKLSQDAAHNGVPSLESC